MNKIQYLLLCFLIIPVLINGYVLESNRTVIKGDSVFMFEGVSLKSGSYHLIIDSAYMLREDSVVIMPMNFILSSGDSLIVKAEKGEYSIKSKHFILNNQKTETGSSIIYSDIAEIFVKDSLHIFYNNLNASFNAGEELKSDTLIIDRREDYLKAISNVKLISINGDFTINAGLFVRSNPDSFEFFIDSVTIEGDEFILYTDSIANYINLDYMISPYNNTIINPDYNIKGDILYAFIRNDSLVSANMFENIIFYGENDERTNELSCNEMIITFIEGKINEIQFKEIDKAKLIIKGKEDEIKSRESE